MRKDYAYTRQHYEDMSSYRKTVEAYEAVTDTAPEPEPQPTPQQLRMMPAAIAKLNQRNAEYMCSQGNTACGKTFGRIVQAWRDG